MRAAAWGANTDQVEAEADHVHNLPRDPKRLLTRCPQVLLGN